MKKLIALLAAIIASTSLHTTFADFADVTDDTGYQTAIYWMQNSGIIEGYKNSKGTVDFRPEQPVTRAEFLKMLFKTLEVTTPKPTVAPFKDVTVSDWSAPYIQAAKTKGTVQGYSGNLFKPNQSVTRGEAIKMATLEFNGGKIPEYTSYFNGAEDVDPATWYLDYDPTAWHNQYFMYVLATDTVGMKHTDIGDPNGFHYYPNQPMTRKEVAEMLFRMKVVKDHSLKSYDMQYDHEYIEEFSDKDSDIDVELTNVKYEYSDSSVPEMGDLLTFDFYLNRVDLGVTENYSETAVESGTTASLSQDLQTKEIYITESGSSDESSKIQCINTYYPHTCNVEVSPNKTEYSYKVVVVFKDGKVGTKTITIKKPEALSRPTVNYPTSNPAQNSKFKMTFTDVGADTYKITVTLCDEYKGDGINPCLNEMEYTLTRVGNSFNVNFIGEAEDNADYPKVAISNGQITISSNFLISYESGVDYRVVATLNGKISNIPYRTVNSGYKGLYISTPSI